MTVSNLNPKALDKAILPVPALDNKEQNKVCSSTQEAAVSAKTEGASAETLAAIAQHPLADLFGKYSGEVWEEVFAGLEQDRLDRQSGQTTTVW